MTGTSTYCGTAFCDCSTMVARYAPGSNPVPVAVKVRVAGPVPLICERLNQDVVRFAGKMDAVQEAFLSVNPTAIDDCATSPTALARSTVAGLAVSFAGVAGASVNDTVSSWNAPSV